MNRNPPTGAPAAGIRLMQIQTRVLDAVEQELKKAGFPPLAWYDALLELSRAPSGEMRPVELEKQMLLPQHSTSRLIDRLVDEGLAARRECKIDKRGQFAEITAARHGLVGGVAGGGGPASEFRDRTEHEKTPFTLGGHSPVAYQGARGIGALLEGMQLLLGWEPIMERGNIIGLYDVTGGGAISLEPGGQFELSGAPVDTVHQTQSGLMAHLAQGPEIAQPLGDGFLGLGTTPSWSRAQIPVMPKGRYKIMTDYMPKVGQYGLDMMYRTCTVKTNLDFPSEADMVKKPRESVA